MIYIIHLPSTTKHYDSRSRPKQGYIVRFPYGVNYKAQQPPHNVMMSIYCLYPIVSVVLQTDVDQRTTEHPLHPGKARLSYWIMQTIRTEKNVWDEGLNYTSHWFIEIRQFSSHWIAFQLRCFRKLNVLHICGMHSSLGFLLKLSIVIVKQADLSWGCTSLSKHM